MSKSLDFDPATFDPHRKHDPGTVKPAGRTDTASGTSKPAGRLDRPEPEEEAPEPEESGS